MCIKRPEDVASHPDDHLDIDDVPISQLLASAILEVNPQAIWQAESWAQLQQNFQLQLQQHLMNLEASSELGSPDESVASSELIDTLNEYHNIGEIHLVNILNTVAQESNSESGTQTEEPSQETNEQNSATLNTSTNNE